MGHDKDQPARAANIAAIASYLTDGIKQECKAVGIELEYTLVHSDGTPVSYSSEFGQRALLAAMADDYGEQLTTPAGDLIGLLREGESVTLEPAAQVEISAGPFGDLNEAKAAFCDFKNRLEAVAGPHGIEVTALGYHPTAKAADLELLPKPRYALMNAYLGGIGEWGVRMMRGSASTQVSIDYCSVEDCLRKMRLACACVPLLSLICDNSTSLEGKPRTHQLVRTEVWNGCDPDRCGLVPGVMDDGFSFEAYAEYVLDTPAIVAHADSDSLCEATFGEVFANETMTQQDVEHALSMLFTDVRLKKYIEIRPADAMPPDYAVAYAALIKGLFYDAGSLDVLDELFGGVGADDIMRAKADLMREGYDAHVYGRPASEVADTLARTASNGLPESERDLLAPLLDLISARTTLACITERTGGRE